MIDKYTEQCWALNPRDSGGRWTAIKNPRIYQIGLRIERKTWEALRDRAAHYDQSAAAYINDQLSQAYVDYASRGDLPRIQGDAEDVDAIRDEWHSIRVDAAGRSMADELSEVSGVPLSVLIRSLILSSI